MQNKIFTIKEIIEQSFNHSKDLSHNEFETLKEYYYNYLENGNYWLQNNELNYKEIYQLMIDLQNPKVLDAGSGCGTEAITFGLLGADVLGVEIKEKRLNVANKRKQIFNNIYDKNTIVNLKLDNGSTILYGNERVTTPSNLKQLFKKKKFSYVSNRYYQPLPNNKKFKTISKFVDKLHMPSILYSKYLLVLKKNS